MDTRRDKETMDHKEAEDTVEGTEETGGSKQCNKGVEQCNDAELYWRRQCKSCRKWTV